MCRKSSYLVCFVLVLGLVLMSTAEADLVGWWKFDEGSGNTASDASGNGNNGTLQGGPTWVVGRIGGALRLDGTDDYVQVPHADILTVDDEVTVMAWIYAERYIGPTGDDWQGILSKGSSPSRSYNFYTEVSGALHFSVGGYGPLSTTQVPLNEWVHVCAMVVDGQIGFYINGEPAGLSGSGVTPPGAADTANVVIGRTDEGTSRSFLGMIDDVRIYNEALSQEEVQRAMLGEGQPYAINPTPPDGTIHEATWANCRWRAGDSAEALSDQRQGDPARHHGAQCDSPRG